MCPFRTKRDCVYSATTDDGKCTEGMANGSHKPVPWRPWLVRVLGRHFRRRQYRASVRLPERWSSRTRIADFSSVDHRNPSRARGTICRFCWQRFHILMHDNARSRAALTLRNYTEVVGIPDMSFVFFFFFNTDEQKHIPFTCFFFFKFILWPFKRFRITIPFI